MTTQPLPTVIDELANLPERIKASTARLVELATQTANERATRDGLIVQAVDHAGMTAADVARVAGITQTHVTRILANASED